MSGGEVLRVHGADTVERTMRAAAKDLADMSEADRTAGDLVARAARGYAPRRTGRLVSTITAATTAEGATISAGAGIRYAGVQEFGWPRRHIQPSRFMFRAMNDQEGRIVDTYERQVDKVCDQVKGA